MNSDTDTIAAISTAPGKSAISIVRISGPKALPIADAIFSCSPPIPSARAPGTFTRGFVHDYSHSKDHIIDEAILLLFRAPHSYTRQDLIELQGHGGTLSATRILRAATEAGARPAGPGEFTRRAFLSGRIDLPQAEAVLDLIAAKNSFAARASARQLTGALSCSLTSTYDTLLKALGMLEVLLDFPEADSPPDLESDALSLLAEADRTLATILAGWDSARVARTGLRVVIAGPPNAGKSTLFNALVGFDRAIVTPEPGTTRDTLEEEFLLQDYPICLVDTAGIRQPESQPESAGIRRTESELASADLTIVVLGPEADATTCDQGLLCKTHSLVVLNKQDLLRRTKPPAAFSGISAIPATLVTGDGVNEIRREILALTSSSYTDDPPGLLTERHRHHLSQSHSFLHEATDLLRSESPSGAAVAASLIREAAGHVAGLLGRNIAPDVLDSIFANFCIGK